MIVLVCCSVLQSVTVCCNVLQCTYIWKSASWMIVLGNFCFSHQKKPLTSIHIPLTSMSLHSLNIIPLVLCHFPLHITIYTLAFHIKRNLNILAFTRKWDSHFYSNDHFESRRCVAACCSVLQRAAVCCSVLQSHWESQFHSKDHFESRRCVAVCCSVLQYAAVCCSVLQSHWESHSHSNDDFESWKKKKMKFIAFQRRISSPRERAVTSSHALQQTHSYVLYTHMCSIPQTHSYVLMSILQKSRKISVFFAENDLQFEASYGSLPLCIPT